MRSLSSIPRPLLVAFAILFAGTLLVYTAIWVYYAEWSPPVHIGVETKLDYTPYMTIKHVAPSSSADRAGLRANDRILSIDGYRQDGMSVSPAFAHGKAGDVVTVVAERPGVAEPLIFQVTLEAAPPPEPLTPAQWLAVTLIDYYPLPFLIVGLSVLFLRLEDRNAWLLALMFAGFIAAASVFQFEGVLSPPLRRFMLSYHNLLFSFLPAVFYLFFATFPSPSPIDRRWPRLKHFFVVVGFAISLPLAAIALVSGRIPLKMLEERPWLDLSVLYFSVAYSFGGIVLGLVSLIWNNLDAPTRNDRRKTQVMVWGTVAGVVPVMLVGAVALIQHRVMYESFWLVVLLPLGLALLPLSFARQAVRWRILPLPRAWRSGWKRNAAQRKRWTSLGRYNVSYCRRRLQS